MTTQAKVTRDFRYDVTLGRTNLSGIGFRNPVDLALAKGGNIYVINRANEAQPFGTRISWLDINQDFHGEFGQRGTEDGQFIWPLSIAVAPDDRVFVADEWLSRIVIFGREGQPHGTWGTKGSGDSELDGPSGLVFDSEGNLLVSDGNNHRIQKFTPEGVLVSGFGTFGAGEGQLNQPWGITVDHQGDIFVADWRNDRIQKFTSEGQFLLQIGTSGSGEGQLNRPTGVAVDRDGDIYVTDWLNDRVQVFDAQGNFVTSWTGDANLSKWAELQLAGSPDVVEQRDTVPDMLEMEKRFREPIAVEVDEQNRIMVLDCRRDRIQVYKKVS